MNEEQGLNDKYKLLEAAVHTNNFPNKLYTLRGEKLPSEIPEGFSGFDGVKKYSAPIPTLHKLYVPHSMYHMSQLLILILQDFFSEGLPKDFNWQWTNDFKTTNILFDTVFNKEGSGIGKKPLVVVSHGDVSLQQVSVGNLHSGKVNMPNSTKEAMYSSLAQSSFTIQIVSSAYAESELIGSLIFNYLTALQLELPNLIGVHKLLSITCTGTNPIRENEQLYLTSIIIPVTLQMSWLSKYAPSAEKLQSLRLTIDSYESDLSVEMHKELIRVDKDKLIEITKDN